MKLEDIFSEKSNPKDKAFERIAELMIKKVEEISKDWKCPWFRSVGILPQSIDGNEYNGMNIFPLLVYCEEQGYKAPIFGTYDKFMSLNYDKNRKPLVDKNGEKLPFVSVKKGEQSFPVFKFLFKVVNRETKETIKFDDYKLMSEDEKNNYAVYPRMMVYPEFNIDQTNLEETRPELYKKLVAKNISEEPKGNNFHVKVLDDMIKEQSWLCPIKVSKSDSAYFSPSKDFIQLPQYEQFYKGEEFYSTMLHECAHSTGHKDRLDRFKQGKDEYGREELVAEMCSALICYFFGIQNGVQENSAAYLKGWCENIKKDSNFIKEVMFDVKKAFDLMNKTINKEAKIVKSNNKTSKRA